MILSICESSSVLKVIYMVKTIITIIKVSVPIMLIISLMIDYARAVINNDELKKSNKKLVSKIIAALLIFLIPTFISLIINIVGTNSQIKHCLDNANPDSIKVFEENEKEQLEEIKRQEEEKKKKKELEKQKINVESGLFERNDFEPNMEYIEVVPEGAKGGMPLVIYLHGLGSWNNFSSAAPNYSITNYVKSGQAYNETGEKFMFVIPKYVMHEADSRGRINFYGTSQGYSEGQKLKRFVDFIINRYKTDTKRIYITGVSLGGDAVWYMVDNFPEVFAAGVVVSGCPDGSTNPSNFLNTPILGYNGTGATEKSAGYTSCVPNMINRINSSGGHAEHRVRKKDHGGMQYVYSEDKDVFKWMLSHKRK